MNPELVMIAPMIAPLIPLSMAVIGNLSKNTILKYLGVIVLIPFIIIITYMIFIASIMSGMMYIPIITSIISIVGLIITIVTNYFTLGLLMMVLPIIIASVPLIQIGNGNGEAQIIQDFLSEKERVQSEKERVQSEKERVQSEEEQV